MNALPIALIRPGSPAVFPPLEHALKEPNGLLAMGGDLAPERMLAAYRHGIFPWFDQGDPILWWSPDPRCVFHTDAIHVSHSLRRQFRDSNWRLSCDRDFDAVITACAAPRPRQPGTWIIPAVQQAYRQLHRKGHAHSVEVWQGDTLVGGIYGVTVGRLFSGESMFSRRDNASKIALLGLARALAAWRCPVLDAQVPNPHLKSLGAVEMPRSSYLALAAELAASAADGAWSALPITHACDLV